MQIKINQRPVQCQSEENLLSLLRAQGEAPPSLCSLDGLKNISVCRLCIVEVGEERKILQSCQIKTFPNLLVFTDSPRLRQLRKTLMEMILTEHGQWHNQGCEVCSLARELGAIPNISSTENQATVLNDYLVWDSKNCIHCDRCIRSCPREDTISRPLPKASIIMNPGNCTGCGDCVRACPAVAMISNNL